MRTSTLVLFSILLWTLSGASAFAEGETNPQACLSSDPQQSEILDQFKFESNDPEFKVDLCDPNNFGYRVAKALLFMKSIGGSSAGTFDQFDRGVLANDPFGFFATRIKTLRFEPKGGTCTGDTTAYVIKAGAQDGVMHICPQLAQTSELVISSEFIHEARHQDGFPHVVCDHGYFIGDKAGRCDASYEEGGALGVQTEYFVKVYRSPQVELSIRQEARTQAIQHFVSRFNKLPLGIKKGALLLTPDLRVEFYDGKTTTPLRSLPNSDSVFYQVADAIHIYDRVGKTEATVDDGVKYGFVNREFNGDLSDTQLVDFYFTSVAKCFLFTKRAVCIFPNRKYKIEIKDFTPIGFESNSPLSQSENEVHIISKEGGRYSLTEKSTSFRSERTAFMNYGDWDASHWIVLGFNGKVSLLNKSGGKSPAQGIRPDRTFIKMIAPHYWSKELQNL